MPAAGFLCRSGIAFESASPPLPPLGKGGRKLLATRFNNLGVSEMRQFFWIKALERQHTFLPPLPRGEGGVKRFAANKLFYIYKKCRWSNSSVCFNVFW
jgi:hypothetical protein